MGFRVETLAEAISCKNWCPIREVVVAPVGLASLVLVIGLAFMVNAIEFVCSAALPAVYTHSGDPILLRK